MGTRTTETLDRVKKELTYSTQRLPIPNSENFFYILCDASNYGIAAALLQKKLNLEEWNSFLRIFVCFLPKNLDFQPFSANVLR